MQIEGPRKGTPSLRVECTPSFAPKHCAKMPCSDRDHEHPPWPEGVEQVLVIEACETKCGWCKYHTNFANNLRVHARRHVANKNEISLQKVIVVNGKAGRKRVKMERRRFPAPQARNEDFEPSSAWGPLDILARKATESEDDNAMAYDMERPGFCRQHEPGTIPTLPPQPTPGPDIPREGTPATIDAMVLQDSRRYQLLLLDAPFSNSMFISGQISTAPAGPNLLDPSLFNLYEDFEQQPLSISVWEARPVHYPATCRFDKVCLELLQKLKPLNSTGGNALEFSNPGFPNVQALLNPQDHSLACPLAAAIVSNIIDKLNVESLPEQIAIMYVMCSIIRWMITGSEQDYYSMPDWLRPGAAQIVTAHPAWVDMMPWPKSRDRLCRDAQYHDKYEAFNNAYNETISINWPYGPSTTIFPILPAGFAVNPCFITHICRLSNWTIGPSFLEKYPDFKGEVNIGKPRVVHWSR